MIPSNPEWCTRCRNPQAYGLNGPCDYHKGPQGGPVSYAGPEVYHPSDWIKKVVGRPYQAHDGIFRIIGYDPRSGFVMRNEVYPYNERWVAEHAIDRTLKEVRDQSPK